MVRIGGGWDTFEHYITKHDPCRTLIAGMLLIHRYREAQAESKKRVRHSITLHV